MRMVQQSNSNASQAKIRDGTCESWWKQYPSKVSCLRSFLFLGVEERRTYAKWRNCAKQARNPRNRGFLCRWMYITKLKKCVLIWYRHNKFSLTLCQKWLFDALIAKLAPVWHHGSIFVRLRWDHCRIRTRWQLWEENDNGDAKEPWWDTNLHLWIFQSLTTNINITLHSSAILLPKLAFPSNFLR